MDFCGQGAWKYLCDAAGELCLCWSLPFPLLQAGKSPPVSILPIASLPPSLSCGLFSSSKKRDRNLWSLARLTFYLPTIDRFIQTSFVLRALPLIPLGKIYGRDKNNKRGKAMKVIGARKVLPCLSLCRWLLTPFYRWASKTSLWILSCDSVSKKEAKPHVTSPLTCLWNGWWAIFFSPWGLWPYF